jgi:hypothetical protein
MCYSWEMEFKSTSKYDSVKCGAGTGIRKYDSVSCGAGTGIRKYDSVTCGAGTGIRSLMVRNRLSQDIVAVWVLVSNGTKRRYP